MEEESSDSIHSFHDRYEYDSDRSYGYDPDGYYDRHAYYVPTNNSDKEEEQQQEESNHDHRTKRRKHAPILEVDRISTLPESILISILSLLTTKQAIKTSVLSKRWAHLWTSLPSLRFDSYQFENAADFAAAVNGTLLLHKAPKLTNFSITFVRFDYEPYLQPHVDRWVRFATIAKVELLSLHLSNTYFIDSRKAYILPQHLCANEFVSELDFCSCKIKPSGLVNWSSLKRLCIGFTALCEDGIRKVLMGSPRLEFLKLNNCIRFNRLDIVSESLRKLVIDGYLDRDYIDNSDGGSDEAELEIVAPKIHSLEIVGDFFRKKCWIKNVSALVEVKLQFFSSSDFKDFGEEDACKRHEDNVKKLLESLHHVKNLTVGKWCLTALSIMSVKHLPSPLSKCKCLTIQTSMGKCDFPGIGSLLQSSPYVETLVIDITSCNYMWPAVLSIMSVKHLSSPVLNCKCLTMKTSMEKWNLPGIASLLQSSPYVETLVIDIIFSNHDSEFLDKIYDEVNHWKSKEVYFKSLLQCLKTLKIFGFGERVHTKDVFILVVEFLLKNAKVLEKMVITEPWVMQNGIHNMQLKFLQVSQKLLSFPRSSPHAVVMFPF